MLCPECNVEMARLPVLNEKNERVSEEFVCENKNCPNCKKDEDKK